MSEQLHRYVWGNNPKRAKLKGRICRKMCAGSMNSVLIEFMDNGELVNTSIRALRKIKEGEK